MIPFYLICIPQMIDSIVVYIILRETISVKAGSENTVTSYTDIHIILYRTVIDLVLTGESGVSIN